MPALGEDGRFVRNKGININIIIFTIKKYSIAFYYIF